jgi:predicted RNA-binding protein with PUA-like domain
MPTWLLKTEPSDYSIADLQADGTTIWDGVSNALALKNLRCIKAGDGLLIYHTGTEKAIVGSAVAKSDAAARHDDLKDVVVEIKYKSTFSSVLSLAEMKADKAFEGWDLLRLPRLSVMSVPDKILAVIQNRCGR